MPNGVDDFTKSAQWFVVTTSHFSVQLKSPFCC